MAKKQLDSLATILDDKHKMLGDNLDFVIEKVSDFETVWKGVLSKKN
tara:strand:+ start:286 stop:426 length:141 start_codon:yes stop_codon:yes gene_type:complete